MGDYVIPETCYDDGLMPETWLVCMFKALSYLC